MIVRKLENAIFIPRMSVLIWKEMCGDSCKSATCTVSKHFSNFVPDVTRD